MSRLPRGPCCLALAVLAGSSAPPDRPPALTTRLTPSHHRPPAAPERRRKTAFGAARSHESGNLIRFPRVSNATPHAVCRTSHWVILISHFTAHLVGPWAGAAFQGGGAGNARGAAGRAAWVPAQGDMWLETEQAPFQRTLQSTFMLGPSGSKLTCQVTQKGGTLLIPIFEFSKHCVRRDRH